MPGLLVGGERTRVAHHHLEQDDALGTRLERAERVALVEGDVRPRPAANVAARHLALEHEHDVVAVVPVRLHERAGVPPRVQRQEAVVEVEPLLVHRRGALAVLLAPHLLPREVVEVHEAGAAGHAPESVRIRPDNGLAAVR